MNTQIDISIEYQGRQEDYRIPTGVTMGRFVELMHHTLKSNSLPKDWTLALKDSSIRIHETDILKDFPLGDGEVFLVVPLEKESAHESL